LVEHTDNDWHTIGETPPHPALADAIQDAEPASHAHVDGLIANATRARRRDYDRLEVLAEEAYELACRPDSDGRQYHLGMASALALLAHLSAVRGEAETAVEQASRALDLLESQEPTPLGGDLYLTIGIARHQTGTFIEALRSLMTAQHIADMTGDRSLAAHALDRIAMVYHATQRSEFALDMQIRALAIHRELRDEVGEALVLTHMAYTYLGLDRFREARDLALKALRWAEQEHSLHLLMKALDTIAEVYRSTGELDMAAEYSARSYRLALEHRSAPDRGDALFTMARIAVERERYAEALDAAQRSLSVAQALGRTVEEYSCHELLSRIQERRGDSACALAHARCHHSLERKHMNQETASRLAALQVEHEVEAARKDAEIHRLTSIALQREIEQGRVAQTRLEAQASLDPLTGLFNRGYLSMLADDLERALASGLHVSVILADIDLFKRINDAHGHFAGDRALIAVARLLRDNARDTDTPVRYGGDEFMVLLVGNGADETRLIAERVRRAVQSNPVEHAGVSIPMTTSMGVASADAAHFEGLVALIGRADRALYAAKQAGRNRVVVDEAG